MIDNIKLFERANARFTQTIRPEGKIYLMNQESETVIDKLKVKAVKLNTKKVQPAPIENHANQANRE